MATHTVVRGLNELRKHLSSLEASKKAVFVLFTGDKNETDGKSWCPDCNVADPVIEKNLSLLEENSAFVTCFVGDRPT